MSQKSWLTRFFRASVAPECVTKYNELKLGKEIKYIIYKLSDDYKEVVVEDYSSDKDWDNFRNKLLEAKASYKGKEGKGPRYAVYDFQWDLPSGEGTRFANLNVMSAENHLIVFQEQDCFHFVVSG